MPFSSNYFKFHSEGKKYNTFPTLKQREAYKSVCDNVSCCSNGKYSIYYIIPKKSASESMVSMGKLNGVNVAAKTSLKYFKDDYKRKGDFISQLGYERKIYETIVNVLSENSVTPNFIGYIGTDVCDFDKFRKDTYMNIKDKNAKDEFKTQIQNLYDEFVDGGYSKVGYYGSRSEAKIDCHYTPDCAVTLFMEKLKKFSNLEDEIQALMSAKNPNYTTTLDYLMIQIIYNVHVLQSLKMNHYDAHFENISIEKDTSGTPFHGFIYYVLDDNMIFKVNTKNNLVKFFDWDLSYADIVSEKKYNEALDGAFCDDYGRCNEFVKGWDMIQIMSHLSDYDVIYAKNTIGISMLDMMKIKYWWFPFGKPERKWKKIEKRLGVSDFFELCKNPDVFLANKFSKYTINFKEFLKENPKTNQIYFNPQMTQKKIKYFLDNIY